MKFWDTSAIVPLFVAEPSTKRIQEVLAKDSTMSVWWGTEVECASAIARLERNGAIDSPRATLAIERLRKLSESWNEIDPNDVLRETAIRFLRVHALRAADALQLAAALLAAERRPATLEIVTLDERLAAAARKEGFMLVDIGLA